MALKPVACKNNVAVPVAHDLSPVSHRACISLYYHVIVSVGLVAVRCIVSSVVGRLCSFCVWPQNRVGVIDADALFAASIAQSRHCRRVTRFVEGAQ